MVLFVTHVGVLVVVFDVALVVVSTAMGVPCVVVVPFVAVVVGIPLSFACETMYVIVFVVGIVVDTLRGCWMLAPLEVVIFVVEVVVNMLNM